MLKGYMFICRNAEGVHGKRKVGTPALVYIFGHVAELTYFTNTKKQKLYYLHDNHITKIGWWCTALQMIVHLNRSSGLVVSQRKRRHF